MTTLVMAAILLFGIVGYRTLPVSDLPSVDYPTINVSASLPAQAPAPWRPPCDAAGKTILHHCRHRLDVVGQLARQFANHHSVFVEP